MDGWIESHIVDPKMPPFEDGAVAAEPPERPSSRPSDNMWEVKWRLRTNRGRSRSPPNIITSNRNSREVNNAPRGRGIPGLNNSI